MPLKLNVGISRKVGQPDYGSLGAQCNIEVELEGSVLDNPESLRRRIGEAYDACRSAVQDELSKYSSGGTTCAGTTDRYQRRNGNNGHTPAHGQNGHKNGGGQHCPGDQPSGSASSKQLSYIRQLAGQIDTLGVRKLDELSGRMFGKPLAAISALEASGMIDTLKAAKSGKLDPAGLVPQGVGA